MNVIFKRFLLAVVVITLVFWIGGCEPALEKPEVEPTNLDTTVGQLGQLYQYSAVPVKGYGIVAGLAGTGSSECPPELRRALSKYIRTHTGSAAINPNKFINSLDTAVVEIYGTIPAVASKGGIFDVKVVAFSRTKTTSLAGGTLYTADLKEMARLVRFDMYSVTLARAHGPVFLDETSGGSRISGYVLGGGEVSKSVRLAFGLYKPSYLAVSAIRNLLNERFEPGTAKAISPNEIEFMIPARYREQKTKFLSMVRLLYLAEDNILRDKRIKTLVEKMAVGEDKLGSEYALEAIGRSVLGEIAKLLESGDERVRFHAARCMLAIGDERGIGALRDIVRDRDSLLRVAAVEAIGLNAKRNIASAILSRLLREEDFAVKFAAYEQLLRLDDIAVSRKVVANKFFIDEVSGKGPKIIYVAREDVPRIVIFGGPVNCEKGIYVESADRSVIINAPAGAGHVSVMRKLANRPRLVGPVSSSYDLTDVIRTLCENPAIEGRPQMRSGLGASYSDMVSVLSKMCSVEAIKAEYIASDLTDAGSFVERVVSNDR